MSIFVALIFQVLFVFFAMVINVGLLVHDKINLQNAVDLGVYYAAQRQAEIMNEIAHINYQLRQDYKLLTWRFRALGTMGRNGETYRPTEQTQPPLMKKNPGSLSEKEWVNPFKEYKPDELPSICVANNMWSEYLKDTQQEENRCAEDYGKQIPRIPDLPVIAPFVPGVASAAAFTKAAQEAQIASCERSGPLNWAFTMQILYAYKLSIATRKLYLLELRRNLISSEIKDRNNDLVKDGVKSTIVKNLTWANRNNGGAGFQDTDFEVINGLADPNCNRGDDGEFIMPEILTAPVLLYTNFDCDRGDAPFQAAQSVIDKLKPDELAKWDPSNIMRNIAKGEPDPNNPIHSTLGFEKNPWCMAYMGVKARTKVRKPFAPLGQPIQLEARAFAQPFGGRIGPWYKEGWTRGAETSTEGERVDPLTSPRLLGGTLDDTSPKARLPNYSRFPGDRLGMKSEIALGAQNRIFRSYGPPRDRKNRLKLEWYAKFDNIPTVGDPLASSGDITHDVRKAEMSAVLPDLFDVTYYSIDPNYMNGYVRIGPERFNVPPLFGQAVKQIPDIGGRLDIDSIASWDIEKQIAQARTEGIDQQVLPKLFYVIEDWKHLLTGWVANSAQDFATFPSQRFGRCQQTAAEGVPVPGRCWMGGGRVGYSVRLVSRNHLQSDTWQVGGEGQSGSILNPPSPDF